MAVKGISDTVLMNKCGSDQRFDLTATVRDTTQALAREIKTSEPAVTLATRLENHLERLVAPVPVAQVKVNTGKKQSQIYPSLSLF